MEKTQAAASFRTLPQTEEFYDYVVASGQPPDDVLQDLSRRTQALGDIGRMQIPAEQGAFLNMLAHILAPSLAVEVGTFTGYSALWIARGMPEGSQLLCCDISSEWTDIARIYWDRAQVSDKIRLVLAPASETLANLAAGTKVDFAFIDADKSSYINYYEALVPLLSDKGLIAVDNVLWSGKVIDPSDSSADTQALRDFNSHVVSDPRTKQVVLPIGDGVSLISLA